MWTLCRRHMPWPQVIMAVLFTMLLGALVSHAADIYVSPTGSGSACTLGSPCPLNTGLGQLGQGETLFMRGGTYNHTDVKHLPCFTSGPPATIRNYQTEQAIANRPASGDRPRWDMATGDCGYLDFIGSYNAATDTRGLVFDGVQLRLGTSTASSFTGGHHINIKNVEFRDNPQTWFISEGAHHIVLDNVELHHGGNHGIYINWNDSIIQNSSIHHNGGYGVHWRKSTGDSGKCQPNCGTLRNIIRNTKIYSNEHSGLNWAYGADNKFYNNLVYDNFYFGLNVSGSNQKFWNNTIYGNTKSGQASQGGMRLQSCSEVKNNIVWGNGSQQIFGDVACSTLSNNITTQNPLFVNQNSFDFHLKSGSPAINAGANLSCCVPDDFAHAPRPVGGTYDIGAYEFGGTAPIPGPGDTTPPSVPTGLTVQRDSDT
jgi:hypothetical protein